MLFKELMLFVIACLKSIIPITTSYSTSFGIKLKVIKGYSLVNKKAAPTSDQLTASLCHLPVTHLTQDLPATININIIATVCQVSNDTNRRP